MRRALQVSGLDLRGFNAFRNSDTDLYDAEHAYAVEGPHVVTPLAPPLLGGAPGGWRTRRQPARTDGLLNGQQGGEASR